MVTVVAHPSVRVSSAADHVVLGLILLVWSGASGFYIVDASQRGVVLQFGRFKEITELRPSPPWPVQTHETVNLKWGQNNLRSATAPQRKIASRKKL